MGPYVGREKTFKPRKGFIPNPRLKLLEPVSEVMAKPGLGVRSPLTSPEMPWQANLCSVRHPCRPARTCAWLRLRRVPTRCGERGIASAGLGSPALRQAGMPDATLRRAGAAPGSSVAETEPIAGAGESHGRVAGDTWEPHRG